jgi:tRNA nucleotidyltransferase/poly(A) polymerase
MEATMSNVRLFEVGGCVRDEFLGVASKDVDFAVEAPSFEAMEAHIQQEGLKIFLSKPEFLTIRAGVPKGHPLRERCKDADFVLARKDGPSTDGRRPDSVEPGTILDDLARRDFTVNAMARCVASGRILDPFNGQRDLEARELRFVGDPMERIREDGLRVLRALRFSVTKGLRLVNVDALGSVEAAGMLSAVSSERVGDEINKMTAHDTLRALETLERFPRVRAAVFGREGLSLLATMKRRK